jgi:hypothetical protein
VSTSPPKKTTLLPVLCLEIQICKVAQSQLTAHWNVLWHCSTNCVTVLNLTIPSNMGEYFRLTDFRSALCSAAGDVRIRRVFAGLHNGIFLPKKKPCTCLSLSLWSHILSCLFDEASVLFNVLITVCFLHHGITLHKLFYTVSMHVLTIHTAIFRSHVGALYCFLVKWDISYIWN